MVDMEILIALAIGVPEDRKFNRLDRVHAVGRGDDDLAGQNLSGVIHGFSVVEVDNNPRFHRFPAGDKSWNLNSSGEISGLFAYHGDLPASH